MTAGLGGEQVRCRRLVEWGLGAANFHSRAVNGLEDVEIELLATGNPDVEAVALNRVQNPLRVDLQHVLGTFERRIVEGPAVKIAEDRRLLFR